MNGQKFGEEQESEILELKDFVELTLKDPDGNSMADEEYVMMLPDVSELEGRLNADGYVKVESVPLVRSQLDFITLNNK